MVVINGNMVLTFLEMQEKAEMRSRQWVDVGGGLVQPGDALVVIIC